jgi:hypothetical protein
LSRVLVACLLACCSRVNLPSLDSELLHLKVRSKNECSAEVEMRRVKAWLV